MKWPFVRRALYEEVREDLRQEIERNTAACAEADALLARSLAAEKEADRWEIEAKRALDALIAREAAHERQMVASETRYADLMASYRMLRLQGATIPEPAPAAKPAVQPDMVMQAIAERAPDAATRKQMLRQVKIDREAGIPDTEIVLRIERGNRPGEGLNS